MLGEIDVCKGRSVDQKIHVGWRILSEKCRNFRGLAEIAGCPIDKNSVTKVPLEGLTELAFGAENENHQFIFLPQSLTNVIRALPDRSRKM
jgi:hypothetical protein